MNEMICQNCNQAIGSLDGHSRHNGQVVCRFCKLMLANKSAAVNGVIVEHPTASISNFEYDEMELSYGSFRRGKFYLISVGFNIVKALIIRDLTKGSSAHLLVLLLFIVVSLVLVSKRLQNIGKSRWLTLLAIVPFANFYIAFICLVCPEGYQQTKKLDTTGEVVAVLVIGLFALIVLAVVFGVIMAQR